jgi:hypothetical protein
MARVVFLTPVLALMLVASLCSASLARQRHCVTEMKTCDRFCSGSKTTDDYKRCIDTCSDQYNECVKAGGSPSKGPTNPPGKTIIHKPPPRGGTEPPVSGGTKRGYQPPTATGTQH